LTVGPLKPLIMQLNKSGIGDPISTSTRSFAFDECRRCRDWTGEDGFEPSLIDACVTRILQNQAGL